MESHHYLQLRSTEQDRLDEQRMLPCKYFVKGYCLAGSRCRFYHPAPSQIPLTIQVPPLPRDFGTPDSEVERALGSHLFIPHLHYDYMANQTRPTDCQFELDGDIVLYCDSNCGSNCDAYATVYGFENNEDENRVVGEDGDAPQLILNGGVGITSVYDNGLVRYNYAEDIYSSTEEFPVDDFNYDMEDEHFFPMGSKSQTLFTHINWNDFLLPGKSPPPYTDVPIEESTEKPKRGNGFLDRVRPPTSLEINGTNNDDILLEGSSGIKKLSAKEEFQFKVKQIAQELTIEPIQPVRSLDKFFENYENLENLPPEMIVRDESEASSATTSEETTGAEQSEREEGELSDTDEDEEFLYQPAEDEIKFYLS